MKIAAQSDFYFQQYGVEKGLQYLEEQGYKNLVYTITGRYDQPFTTQWTDKELKEYYTPIKEAIQNSNMEILFAILGTDIYLDDLHYTADARRKMCVHAVKAAAYAGCKILGVRPAILVQTIPNAIEKSKEISCSIFDDMKVVADEMGVTLAFINGTNIQGYSYGNHCYGSNVEELLELANKYDGKIIIDPMSADRANEKIEDLLVRSGDKLLGVLLTDYERATGKPVIPTTGCINYPEVRRCLKKANPEATLVTMYTPVFKRYGDFIHRESFVQTMSQLLWKITNVLDSKEAK